MGESSVEQKPTITPLEYLNKLFAYALSLGMSSHEYWEEDTDLLLAYVEAEEIRQRKRNNEMWIQGAYIYQAIGSLAPVLNPFSKEHKAREYMRKPIPLTQSEIEQAEKDKLKRFIEYMDSLTVKE